MIIKSYEVSKNATNFLKYNFFLLYGENVGLKKDIRDIIKIAVKQKDDKMEILSLHENEILDNEDYFYNLVYSGSLFSNKKIITVFEATDKIIKKIGDVYNTHLENVFLIIFSGILEKKSKLRNFFETNKKTICIPCYLDNEKDLEVIALSELKKNNILLSKEAINLLIEKSNSDRNNLKNEIEKIIHTEVAPKIILSSIGVITETDVTLAKASNAILIGFNVRPNKEAKKLAETYKITIKFFNIIYEVLDFVNDSLSGLLKPDVKEKIVGSAEIQEIFKVSKVGKVAGSKVIDGEIVNNLNARLIRDGNVLYTGSIGSIFREKNAAKQVAAGLECGITLKDFADFKEKDVIEVYKIIETERRI